MAIGGSLFVTYMILKYLGSEMERANEISAAEFLSTHVSARNVSFTKIVLVICIDLHLQGSIVGSDLPGKTHSPEHPGKSGSYNCML